MKTSTAGIILIEGNESSKNRVYMDQVGLPTIGVGHLLTKDELSSGKLHSIGVKWADGLTEQQTTDLLDHDLTPVEEAITSLVRVTLNQRQFDSLASFVFNIGTTAFENSTLLRVLNGGAYTQVPAQMRRWVYSMGITLPALVRRREREIEMWNG